MAAPRKQTQGMDDSEALMAVLGVIVLVVVAYFLLKRQIPVYNAFVGAMAWLHTWPFAKAALHFPELIQIPVIGPWLFKPAAWTNLFLEQGNFAYMNAEQRHLVLVASGRTALFYYGWLVVLLTFSSRGFRVDRKYRSLHSLETMIWFQSENWVTSRVTRHINPSKLKDVTPRRLAIPAAKAMRKMHGAQKPSMMIEPGPVSLSPGRWSRSMRPEEYLIANGASVDPEQIERAEKMGLESEAEFESRSCWERLDIDMLDELLAAQLRAPWTGAKDLNPFMRGLFAAMALFYAYDIKRGNALFERLALVADGIQAKSGAMSAAIAAEDGLLTEIDTIIAGKEGQKFEELANGRHAYVESAMPVLLANARKGRGVIAPASFIWLKGQDRLMWYILSAVGNEAVNVEASGAHAHSRAEEQTGKKILRPAVYQASRAILEDYLDMTPERIEKRHRRIEERRKTGEQVDMTLADVISRLSADEEASK